jgi:hypothetical protein
VRARVRGYERCGCAPIWAVPRSCALTTTAPPATYAAKGALELQKWRVAYEQFLTSPDLVPGSAVHVAMYEPRHAPPPPPLPADASIEEQRQFFRALHAGRPHGCIFLRAYLALTHAGSVVGVAAVVVHT